MDELDKIDSIRNRMNVSYDAAHQALQKTNGDVISALAQLEQNQRPDLLQLASELFGQVESFLHGGTIRKLRLRYGDKVITEIPLAATAAAAVLVGAAAIFISKTQVEIERDESEGEQ